MPLTIIPPGHSRTTVSPPALDGLLGGDFDPVSIDLASLDLGEGLGPDLTEQEPTSPAPATPIPLIVGLNSASAQGGNNAPGGSGGGGGSGSQPDAAAAPMAAAVAGAAGVQQSAPAMHPPVMSVMNDYQPPPPTAFDDTNANGVDYWTYHDTTLTSQGSVQGNDMNDVPVTSELASTTTNGTLTLNPDGTFVYTPTYHFFGIDHFTYFNVDTYGASNIATVDIRVTEYPPTAGDDGIDSAGNYLYQVTWNETANDESGHSLAVAGGMDSTENPPSIQANDYSSGGPNSNNLTSILDSGPSHGTIAPLSNPNAIGGIDPNGGFIYTPKPGESGVDHFTYHDTDGLAVSNIATVTIFIVSVNLEIWDGGDWNDAKMVPKKVPDDIELTRGAFTVYNNNDTNGDVMVDSLQSPVTATADGRPEVDLMKIVVNPPGQPAPHGPTSVTLDLTPGLDLWRDSSKVAPYPHMGDPSTGEETMIDTSLLPMTLWVEATVRSQTLRDMGVKESYGEVEDLVHVTSIWATSTAITSNLAPQQVFNQTGLDATTDPGPLVIKYRGTGVIPITNNAYDGIVGVTSGIVVAFNIQPAIPFNSPET
ncbi:MAG TPA: Ig-like domain-containing protein, partial [Pirellulales bacterium]|nr:Ig-like domain-containing protein [Pirellulales bacterium]